MTREDFIEAVHARFAFVPHELALESDDPCDCKEYADLWDYHDRNCDEDECGCRYGDRDKMLLTDCVCRHEGPVGVHTRCG